MIVEQAACHCGNISAEVSLSEELSQYTPRACDCDFCEKHGAAYISDPAGKLLIRIQDRGQTTTYKQGSRLVDLLICQVCGVLVAVTYSYNGELFGGLNSRTLNNKNALQPPVVASPKELSDAEKIIRWQQIWFPTVTYEPV